MHNNYHFFKRLVPELNEALIGYRLMECFSQQKDELILGFAVEGKEFYIKADLKQTFTCLSFPSDFSRARKNSVNLFSELLNKKVSGLRLFRNERCFTMDFENQSLLFKMYGNRSNIIMFKEDAPSEMFKSRMVKDLDLQLSEMDREIDQSEEAFIECDGNLKDLFPTLGKLGMVYLKESGVESGESKERWKKLNQAMQEMEEGSTYIIEFRDDLFLSLFPMGTVLSEHESSIDAINTFYSQRVRTHALQSEKKKLMGELGSRIQKTGNYLKKVEYKLKNLSGNSYRETADLIMANLHAIEPQAKSVTLDNFYTGKPIKISLNARLSPQKNAERYYRKAKNQKKEEEVLRANIKQKSKELRDLEEVYEKVSQSEDLRSIREYGKPFQVNRSEPGVVSLPYRKVEEGDFEILIGKNAKANDELTFSVAQRNDLWLHARDVAGSHVVIRSLKGQPVPVHILEKAAGLAAYHSKRKTDSLCPVIYVERKFVRKFKGSKPGQVRVDHEKVIMVKPLKG